tara:strand:- start:2918 stop:3937 length:1020 start_codon:yes stop_codon:yes gene_type:complete
MTYVFIFTGEFGYELLNWNGVVRKWCSENKNDNDTIIICSRPGMDLIYEMADYYIDVSEIDAYNNSIADCYWSFVRDVNGSIIRQGPHQVEIFTSIETLIKESGFTDVKYIFGAYEEKMGSCIFGNGGLYGPERLGYGRLNVNNNVYKKFSADVSRQSDIEDTLGISLDSPFVLCQKGARQRVTRDKTKLEVDEFIKSISEVIPVVCLGFDTKKLLDSKSTFKDIEGDDVYHYNANTIKEQSCLIEKSAQCIFFTEGDFRSHMYVPPFFGKSVIAVASKAIFDPSPTDVVSVEPGKTNAPLKFWNKNVWDFGGEIIPLYYEKIRDSKNHDKIIKNILLN